MWGLMLIKKTNEMDKKLTVTHTIVEKDEVVVVALGFKSIIVSAMDDFPGEMQISLWDENGIKSGVRL